MVTLQLLTSPYALELLLKVSILIVPLSNACTQRVQLLAKLNDISFDMRFTSLDVFNLCV